MDAAADPVVQIIPLPVKLSKQIRKAAEETGQDPETMVLEAIEEICTQYE